MTFGRRAAVLLAAFVTAVLLAACGGGGGGGDGATSSVAGDAGDEMRLTLTEDGCTYEGPETQATGSFTAEVENESSTYGAFEIGEIAEGSTLADLDAYIAEEQQRWDETQELRGPPAFYTQVVRVGVDAGASSKLPVEVEPGTYALTCFNDDLPTWRGYVAAQLVVTG